MSKSPPSGASSTGVTPKRVSSLHAFGAALAARNSGSVVDESILSVYNEDNSSFATAGYEAEPIPRPKPRPKPARMTRPANNAPKTQPLMRSDYDSSPTAAATSVPAQPAAPSPKSLFGLIKSVLPGIMTGKPPSPTTSPNNATTSPSSSNQRVYTGLEDQQAYMFTDKLSLEDHIDGRGAPLLAANAPDDTGPRPDPRQRIQRTTSRSRSTSRTPAAARMPSLAEEPEEEEDRRGHIAKSTSVSGASSLGNSRPTSPPGSSSRGSVGGRAKDRDSDEEDVEDDPLARGQRRARQSAGVAQRKMSDEQDAPAHRLGQEDDAIPLGLGGAKDDSAPKKQPKHPGSAPKPLPRDKKTPAAIPPAKGASGLSALAASIAAPSSSSTVAVHSRTTSSDSAIAAARQDSKSTPEPSKSSQRTSSSSSSSSSEDEEDEARTEEPESAAAVPSIDSSATSIVSPVASPSNAASVQFAVPPVTNAADPLGLSKASPAKSSSVSSSSTTGTIASGPSAAAAITKKRRRVKKKTARVMPISAWNNLSLEAVVRDALLTRRIMEGLTHLKERLIQQAKQSEELLQGSQKNSLATQTKQQQQHLFLNPVPLFRSIASQLLFQSLSLDHTGSDVLAGAWILRLIKADLFRWLKQLAYEVSGASGRPVREKIFRHFSHLNAGQLHTMLGGMGMGEPISPSGSVIDASPREDGTDTVGSSASSSSTSGASNLFYSDTFFDASLEHALWELEEQRRVARRQKELARLLSTKPSREAMEREKERDKESERLAMQVREAWKDTVLKHSPLTHPQPTFFTPSAFASDAFLYTMFLTLQWAYPSASFTTTWNRSVAHSARRFIQEEQDQVRRAKRARQDARGVFLKGRTKRVFATKHAPDEFALIRGPADVVSSSSAHSTPSGRKPRPAIKTGTASTGGGAVAWEQSPSSQGGVRERESPHSSSSRNRSGTLSVMTLGRSTSSPTAAELAAPLHPGSLRRSGTGGSSIDDSSSSDAASLSSALQSAAGGSTTIHPFLGPIDVDRVAGSSTHRHPDFLSSDESSSSNSSSEESSDTDGAEFEEEQQQQTRQPLGGSARVRLSVSQQQQQQHQARSGSSSSIPSQQRASIVTVPSSRGAPLRQPIRPTGRTISSGSAVLSGSSSSDSSSDSSDSSDGEHADAEDEPAWWSQGEIQDLPPSIQSVSLPLSTEDTGGDGVGSGEHTPSLLAGRAGQIRGLSHMRAHPHFAPLVLSGAESHPLEPGYKGERKPGEQESSEEEWETDDENAPAEEDDPSIMMAKRREEEEAAKLAAQQLAEQDSCVQCRQDNELARASCTHDGYLNLNLLSLSRWSLEQFYLCLLDKQSEFVPPASSNAFLVPSTFSHSPRTQPIDFDLLTKQIAEELVQRKFMHLLSIGPPPSKSNRIHLLEKEHARQKILFQQVRFRYLVSHNDWRRMVGFLENLPLEERRVGTDGRLEFSKRQIQQQHDYSSMLLQSLPRWISLYSKEMTYFMHDLIQTECARHGLFVCALPKVPSNIESLSPVEWISLARRLDFLPLARTLARTGLLFRSARNEDVQPVGNLSGSPSSFNHRHRGSSQPTLQSLRFARTVSDRILSGLKEEDAVGPKDDTTATDNSVLASLTHLLPFRTLGPFHVWFICFLHSLGGGQEIIQILAAYLSHYRLGDFRSLTNTSASTGSSSSSKSTSSTHPLSIFTGWTGVELYLRQGQLFRAGLLNAKTHLQQMGGITGGGSGKNPLGAKEKKDATASTTSKRKQAKEKPSAGAAASSSSSVSANSKQFPSSNVNPILSHPSLSDPSDSSHTQFLQVLFDRGLHVMALATLMYYPRSRKDRRKHGASTRLSTRLISALPSATATTKPYRSSAHSGDLDEEPTSWSGVVSRPRKSGGKKGSSDNQTIKLAEPRSTHLPQYVTQSSSGSLFFSSNVRKRNVGQKRRKKIDFQSTQQLPISWLPPSDPRLLLQSHSVSLIPRLLSDGTSGPTILPFQLFGSYLVQFKELSLALYSLPKRLRTPEVQREEVTTGNMYAYRKDIVRGVNSTISPNFLDASAWEGFGALKQRKTFADDISFFDMITDLFKNPKAQVKGGNKKAGSTSSSMKGKLKGTKGRLESTEESDESHVCWLDRRLISTVHAFVLELFDNPAYTIKLIPASKQPGYVPPLPAEDPPSHGSSAGATPLLSSTASPAITLANIPAKRDQLLAELTGMAGGDDDLLGDAGTATTEKDAPTLARTPSVDDDQEEKDASILSNTDAALSSSSTLQVCPSTPIVPSEPARQLLEVFPPFPPRLPHFSHPAVRKYGDVHVLTFDYFLRKSQPLKAFHVYLRGKGLELNPQGQFVSIGTGEVAPQHILTQEREVLFQAVLTLALKHLLDVRVKVACVVFLHLCGIRAHLLRTMVVAAYRIYRVWLEYNLTSPPLPSSGAGVGSGRSRSGSHHSVGSIGSIGSLGSQPELRVPAFHDDFDFDMSHAQAMVSDDDEMDMRVHEDVMSRGASPRPWQMARIIASPRAMSPVQGVSGSEQDANNAAAPMQPHNPELVQAILTHIQHLLVPLVPVLARSTLIVPTQYHVAFKSLYDATMYLTSIGLADDGTTSPHDLASGAMDPSLTTFDRFFEADTTMWVLVLRFQQAFHQPLTTLPHHLLALHGKTAGPQDTQVGLSDAFSVQTILTQAHDLHITLDELLRLLNQLTSSVESFDRVYQDHSTGEPVRHLNMDRARELDLVVPGSSESSYGLFSPFLHCLPVDLYRSGSGRTRSPSSGLSAAYYSELMKSLVWARLLMGKQELAAAAVTQRSPSNVSSAAVGGSQGQTYTTLSFLAYLSTAYPDTASLDSVDAVPTSVLKSLLSLMHHLSHLSDIDVLLVASRSATSWPSWTRDGKEVHSSSTTPLNDGSDAMHQNGERLLQLCRLSGHSLLALLSFSSPLLLKSPQPSASKTNRAQNISQTNAISQPPPQQHRHLVHCMNVYLYLITTQSMARLRSDHEKSGTHLRARRGSNAIDVRKHAPHSSVRLTHLSSLPASAPDHVGSNSGELGLMEDLDTESKRDVEDTERTHERIEQEEEDVDDDLDEAETFHSTARRHHATSRARRKSSSVASESNDTRRVPDSMNANTTHRSVQPLSSSPLLARYFQSGLLNHGQFKYLLLDYLIHPLLPSPYPHQSLRPLLSQALDMFAPTSPLVKLVSFAACVARQAWLQAEEQLRSFVSGLIDAAKEARRSGGSTSTPSNSNLLHSLLAPLDMFEVATMLLQHLLGGVVDGQEHDAESKAGSKTSANDASSKTSAFPVLYRNSTLPTPKSLKDSPFTPPLRLPAITPESFQQAYLLRVIRNSGFWSLWDVLSKELVNEVKQKVAKASFVSDHPSGPSDASVIDLPVGHEPLSQLYPSFLRLCREHLNALLSVFDQAAQAGRQANSRAHERSNVTHRIRASVPCNLREIHTGLRTTERGVQSLTHSLEKLFPPPPPPAPQAGTENATSTATAVPATDPPMLRAVEPEEEKKTNATGAKAENAAPSAAPTVTAPAEPRRSRFACIPYRLYDKSSTATAAATAAVATKPAVTTSSDKAVPVTEKGPAAAARASEIARANLVALNRIAEASAEEAAIASAIVAPTPLPSTRPLTITEQLESSLLDFQSSFLWQFTFERQSFWTECHGTFVGGGLPREERYFFARRLHELKGQLSLAEKETMLLFINQATTQQQEQERVSAVNADGTMSASTANSAEADTSMSEDAFRTLMSGILRQAIVPSRVVGTSLGSVDQISAGPAASPSSATSPVAPAAGSPAAVLLGDGPPPVSPSAAASSASASSTSNESMAYPDPSTIVPAPRDNPLCLVHNQQCLFRSFVLSSSAIIARLPQSPLPGFLLLVPPASLLGDLGEMERSAVMDGQVWPPALPPSQSDITVVWCGCLTERTAPSILLANPTWLPLSGQDLRFGTYMVKVSKISLGDFVVGRSFLRSSAPLDLSLAKSLVGAFEPFGFKSLDTQLLEIASVIVHHEQGPYPKLPRKGCTAIVRHNSMLQSSIDEPTSRSSEDSKKGQLPTNLSLSPALPLRSLVLDAITSVSWFGRQMASKIHLLWDCAQLLQISFNELYTLSLTQPGLETILARILHACMHHRQRDRGHSEKRLNLLKEEFFANIARAAIEAGGLLGDEDAPRGLDPVSPSSKSSATDPTFLWASIEKLERLKESVREVGRLHAYSELFLRTLQCYTLPSGKVARIIADVLLPYICRAVKDCQPGQNFLVETRPLAPEEFVSATVEKHYQLDDSPVRHHRHLVVPPVQSDNILGGDDGGDGMESASGMDIASAASSSSSQQSLSLDSSRPLTENSAGPDEDDSNIQIGPDGISAAAPKKRTIRLPKAEAAKEKARQLAKTKAREEAKKREAYLKHLAHLELLDAKRATRQLDALERARTNEVVVEEEAWWVLFLKNLCVGLASGGLFELAQAFLTIAQSRSFFPAGEPLPLEVEVRESLKAAQFSYAFASSSSSASATQTHSYAALQDEAVALSLAYKFALLSLSVTSVDEVLGHIKFRLPLYTRLAEEKVWAPLETVTRGILVREYGALSQVFEHSIGFGREMPADPVCARAGLTFLSNLHRSLVPALGYSFTTQLERFLQSAWNAQSMASVSDLSTGSPDEERYVTACRFFGFFRRLASHHLNQAIAGLGEETVALVMGAWSPLRGPVPEPEDMEGRTDTQTEVQPGSHASVGTLTTEDLRREFSRLPPSKLPSHSVASYVQEALNSAIPYLQYVDYDQMQTEVEVMLAFIQFVLQPSSSAASAGDL